MEHSGFDDGVHASVEMQNLIIRLLGENMKPGQIAFCALAIGAGMMVRHHGHDKAGKIVDAMMKEARDGKIDLYPALLAANENAGNSE